MKKFRFRLERVLAHRQTIRQEKQRILILAQRELSDRQDELLALEASLLQVELQEGAIHTVDEVQLLESYGTRLRSEIEQKREQIKKAEEQVEIALQEYSEAARDAEALVKLREKKETDYKRYIESEEFKFLDELTVMRAGLGSQKE